MVVGLTEYFGTGLADILLGLVYAENPHTDDIIHEAVYVGVGVLVCVFSVSGYLAQAVHYSVVEALVVPKRQIKQVDIAVFGRNCDEIEAKYDILHIKDTVFSNFK